MGFSLFLVVRIKLRNVSYVLMFLGSRFECISESKLREVVALCARPRPPLNSAGR